MEPQPEHQSVEVSKIFEELFPHEVGSLLADAELSLLQRNLAEIESPLWDKFVLDELSHGRGVGAVDSLSALLVLSEVSRVLRKWLSVMFI